MYTHGPGSNIVPCSESAITASAFGHAQRAQPRALERVDRDVDRRRRAVADLLAVVQHRRLVLLPLADHDDAVHADRAEHRVHAVDGGLVGGDLVAAADPARGLHRRGLGHAHELEREVAIGRRLATASSEHARRLARAARTRSRAPRRRSRSGPPSAKRTSRSRGRSARAARPGRSMIPAKTSDARATADHRGQLTARPRELVVADHDVEQDDRRDRGQQQQDRVIELVSQIDAVSGLTADRSRSGCRTGLVRAAGRPRSPAARPRWRRSTRCGRAWTGACGAAPYRALVLEAAVRERLAQRGLRARIAPEPERRVGARALVVEDHPHPRVGPTQPNKRRTKPGSSPPHSAHSPNANGLPPKCRGRSRRARRSAGSACRSPSRPSRRSGRRASTPAACWPGCPVTRGSAGTHTIAIRGCGSIGRRPVSTAGRRPSRRRLRVDLHDRPAAQDHRHPPPGLLEGGGGVRRARASGRCGRTRRSALLAWFISAISRT